MIKHLPILVVAMPLIGALLTPVITYLHALWGRRWAIICLFTSMVFSFMQLAMIIDGKEVIHYHLGGWNPPLGIEFVIDGINALVICLVATISSLTALFSSPFECGSLDKDKRFHAAGYYSMLSFLSVGLLGMSSTGDAFNMYVFMEIVALSGYGLIAIGEEKGTMAAFRYLLTGTIGASCYLMGVGLMYSATGTLNMADLSERMANIDNPMLMALIIAFLIVGFGIKMALFPLHGWQPGAHTYAHPAADPMIAGIMIKVPAYAMFRFMFTVFGKQISEVSAVLQVLGVLGICGILYGSLRALRYNKYNKILAYSSIGQVGYIALGFAIGNYYGLCGAILHIINHAFMKTGLFFTSGALKYRYGVHYLFEMGNIYRKMPVTCAALVVFALSMVGIPPFAGFFSKWYLVLGAIDNGQIFYVIVLIISSLLAAIYFFKVFENLFMEKPDPELTDNCKELKTEAPVRILVPIVIAMIMVISLGIGSNYIVNNVIGPFIAEVAIR